MVVTKRFVYDQVGRLIFVVDTGGQITGYTYDELGNQLTQTDANQHTTSYEYDSLGRRTARRLPMGQTERFLYDAAGNLSLRTDFNGTTTSFGYDAMNRLLRRSVSQAAAGVVNSTVTFAYTPTGQRERMVDGHGTTLYGYDNRNRLVSKASPEGTLGYTYDSFGNLASISSSNPNGVQVVYRYDELNRLKEVEENGGEVTRYGYDEVGNLSSVATANGVVHSYGYNPLNRLTALDVTSGSSLLASYGYTQLRIGHRSSANESFAAGVGIQAASRTARYTYDSLYRLTNETLTSATGSSGSVSYILDPVGNRKARNSTIAGLTQQAFTYDANDRLQSDTYDANGNTKVGQVSLNSTGAEAASQTVTDTYDDQNRLVSRNGPSGQIQVVYDGDGNKVRESINGQIITYLIDTLNPTGYAQVLEELQNGTVVRTYTYGHDLLLQDQRDAGGTWSATWYGYDGHGSVRFLTNGAGQITDRYDYDAFGVLLAASGATYNRYRYCGEQYDDALGLYYLRARYMNAASGRFWSMDSFCGEIGEPKSLHKYLYGIADPVNGHDPSGYRTLQEVATSAAVGATIGAIVSVAVTKYLNPTASGTELWKAAGFGALTGALGGVGFVVRTSSVFIQALRVIVSAGLSIFSGIEAITAKAEKEKIVYAAFALLGAWGTVGLAKPFIPSTKPIPFEISVPTKDVLEAIYPRSSPWRKGVREEVYEQAQASSNDGIVRDPFTGVEIKYNEYWELGHEPLFRFSEWQRRAWLEGWSRADWNDFLNDPGTYRPETRFTNGGHHAETPFD